MYPDRTLWDVATRTEIATLEGHTSTVESVSFSPDGIVLASGSQDATVRLWNVTTGRNIATLGGGGRGWVRCVLTRRQDACFGGAGWHGSAVGYVLVFYGALNPSLNTFSHWETTSPREPAGGVRNEKERTGMNRHFYTFLTLILFLFSSFQVHAQPTPEKKKNPFLAVGLSAVVAGAGQIYLGQYAKGALQLGTGALGGVILEETEDEESWVTASPDDELVFMGNSLFWGSYAWSILDASYSAYRIIRPRPVPETDKVSLPPTMKSHFLAFALSAVVPGTGQFYPVSSTRSVLQWSVQKGGRPTRSHPSGTGHYSGSP